jgi:hypothetical protein
MFDVKGNSMEKADAVKVIPNLTKLEHDRDKRCEGNIKKDLQKYILVMCLDRTSLGRDPVVSCG